MRKPGTAERKPVKRAWLRGILILFLSGVALLVLVVSARPKWHTVWLPIERGNSLTAELPGNWDWRYGYNDEHYGYNNEKELIVTPPMPTGLLRWWNEHILKTGVAKGGACEITISVHQFQANDASRGRASIEWAAVTLASSCNRQYQNVKVTPSVQADMFMFDMEARNNKLSIASRRGVLRYVFLAGYDSVKHRVTVITVHLYTLDNYSLLKPTIDEIIRRLRLVQEK